MVGLLPLDGTGGEPGEANHWSLEGLGGLLGLGPELAVDRDRLDGRLLLSVAYEDVQHLLETAIRSPVAAFTDNRQAEGDIAFRFRDPLSAGN
jgi:hypothetical protein